jgi:hypothetical protein
MPGARSVLEVSASTQEYGDDDRELLSKKQRLFFELESVVFFSFKLKLLKPGLFFFKLKEFRGRKQQQRERGRKFTGQLEKEMSVSWNG